MDVKFSVRKILNNRIGYKYIIPLLILIVITIPALIYFQNSTLLMILLIPISIILLIFLFVFLIYIIYNILKIKYYFKYGYENYGIVIDDYFNTEIKYSRSSQYIFYKILSPWNIKDVSSGEYMRLDKKSGVIIKYIVDNEERQNAYSFIVNNETMYIKNGSRIRILINPKNKNDIIIKDIYI